MGGFLNTLDISASGMSAQRIRVNVISSNIANTQTTHDVDGKVYRRREVVFEPLKLQDHAFGVKIAKIRYDNAQAKMRFEPNNPDADKNGYVAYPNINPVIEMSDLLEATRSYQANVAAFQNTKEIANASISLLN